MRAHLLTLTAAGLVSLVLARPADARCARSGLAPEVLTAEVAVPADGGGIVVGTKVVSGDQDQGEAPAKGWGFLTGRDLAVPVITTLAPGLVVYAPPSGTRTTGELTTGSKVVAKLTPSTTKIAKLTAPSVQSISHSHYYRGRGRSSTTTVTLTGKVPADAVALVLVDARTKKAQTWGAVTAGKNSVVVYAQRRCSTLPDGTIEPSPGRQVILRWVDKYGRVSTDSAPAVVSGSKTGGQDFP